MGCLTALAAAGGNERYWKPLVHTVVGAWGHGDRAEVRASALLSVLRMLGEEYMVLLPECLPVLF